MMNLNNLKWKIFGDRVYCVAYRKIENNCFFEFKDSRKFTVIKPSLFYWYADPFVKKVNGKEYIFVESCNKVTGKGKLSYFELGNNTPHTMLEEDFHLSFPNVFEYAGQTYMIPETESDKSISIYKMKSDVSLWERIYKLDVEGIVDTTPFFYEDKFYLLTSKEEENDKRKTVTKLYEVKNFPNNTSIKDLSDKYYSKNVYSYIDRNGGAVISKKGKYYRVIQNSDENIYGRDLTIRELDYSKDIVETNLVDITFDDIKTDKYLCQKEDQLGIHTYNCDDEYEIVDLYYTTYSLWNTIIKFLRKFAR